MRQNRAAREAQAKREQVRASYQQRQAQKKQLSELRRFVASPYFLALFFIPLAVADLPDMFADDPSRAGAFVGLTFLAFLLVSRTMAWFNRRANA